MAVAIVKNSRSQIAAAFDWELPVVRKVANAPLMIEAPKSIRVPGFVFTLGIHPPGTQIPRHTHSKPTICYVLRGRFREHSAGSVAECEPEMLKVMPAEETHWNSFAQTETQGLRIEVEREQFAHSPGILKLLDTQILFRRPAAGELARQIIMELRSGGPTSLIAAEGLALQMIAELAREAEPKEKAAQPQWLAIAEDLIRESVNRPCTIAEIAQAAGVSATTLARGYRRRYGCTIGERIRKLRIEAAARALVETDATLSVVALSAGFYDQSHFSNVFRKHMGLTPSDYRSRLT
jgi:AraC family transcriptional regulator